MTIRPSHRHNAWGERVGRRGFIEEGTTKSSASVLATTLPGSPPPPIDGCGGGGRTLEMETWVYDTVPACMCVSICVSNSYQLLLVVL